MKILNNISLAYLNSFRVESSAKYFTECFSSKELQEFIKSSFFRSSDSLILGGGSNILFTRDIEAIVVKMSIPGIDVTETGDDFVRIRVGAGVEWDEVVSTCVLNGWWGIENLSLIPGSAGAAPIQNIGAYGCEIADTLDSVEFIELKNGGIQNIGKEDCKFGYRNSIFKQKLKGKVIITSINLMLSRSPLPNINYHDLKSELGNGQSNNLSIGKIREAIIKIRNSKLPNPAELGNAGSFFKNPVLDANEFNRLHKTFNEIKYFSLRRGLI